MSAALHHTEIVIRNARQLVIGWMLLLGKSFPQAGALITVARPIFALHRFNSPTNSSTNDILPSTNCRIGLMVCRTNDQ